MTYLSRITLKNEPAINSIAALLIPDRQASLHAGHRLVWSAFSRGGDESRPFLFREQSRAEWLVSSSAMPSPNGVLDVETRKLSHDYVIGQRLHFSLRANPVVKVCRAGKRSAKVDVVMRAIKDVPSAARGEAREEAVQTATAAWLERQGARAGFRVLDVYASGYRQQKIPRRGAAPITISTVDLAGEIEVTDPNVLPKALAKGFGSSRAFGCGLMLIRPSALPKAAFACK
jgi:CRISPR system Cascade subunit CasE